MSLRRAAGWLLLVCAAPPAYAQRVQLGGVVRCSVQGKVLYAHNLQPAAQVRVRLLSSGAQTVIQERVSDALGAFQFSDLPRDTTYTIEVSAEGYRPSAMGGELSVSCPADVTIMLQPKSVGESKPPGDTVSVDDLAIPGKARKAFARGVRELEERRPDRSLAHFRKAIELHPEYSEAYVQLSLACIDQADYAGAQQALEAATGSNPRSARPYVLLGIVYRQQGEVEKSIQVLREAVKLDPKAWVGHLELGNILLAAGRIEEAYEHARKAHELNAQPARVHVLVYNLCVLRRDFTAARAELDEFLELHPESPWAQQASEQRTRLRELVGTQP